MNFRLGVSLLCLSKSADILTTALGLAAGPSGVRELNEGPATLMAQYGVLEAMFGLSVIVIGFVVLCTEIMVWATGRKYLVRTLYYGGVSGLWAVVAIWNCLVIVAATL